MKAWSRAWSMVGTQAERTLRIGVLSLTAGLWCGVLNGQPPRMAFKGSAGIGSTVSVATLQIPEKAWRHFEKAKDLAAHDRFAEADAEAQKAVAISPGFADAYVLRASAQVRLRSFDAAVASIVQARQIEPDPLWAGVLLAGAYNSLHRFNDAEIALDRLHGLEAESWQAAYERARAAVGRLDVEGALHWSRVACAAAPDRFFDVLLVRANAFTLAHRWDESAAQMESYLRSGEAQAHRAEVLAALPEIRRRAREQDLSKLALR